MLISKLRCSKNFFLILAGLFIPQLLSASFDNFYKLDPNQQHTAKVYQHAQQIRDPLILFNKGHHFIADPVEYNKLMENHCKIPAHKHEHDQMFQIPEITENYYPQTLSIDIVTSKKMSDCIEKLIISKFDELNAEFGFDYVDFIENRTNFYISTSQAMLDAYLLEQHSSNKETLWTQVKKSIDAGKIRFKINCDVFPVFENPWYKEAITRVLACNDQSTILAYYRALQHNGGHVPSDVTNPLSPKVFFDYFHHMTFKKQYLLTPLANRLATLGIQQLHYINGCDVEIHEGNQISVIQNDIINELFTRQISSPEIHIKYRNVPYHFINQGKKIIANEVVLENFIIDGPLFIKANKLTLKGNIDALAGMVAAAKEFDLKKARIWQFGSNHFIKSNKIDLTNDKNISF